MMGGLEHPLEQYIYAVLNLYKSFPLVNPTTAQR